MAYTDKLPEQQCGWWTIFLGAKAAHADSCGPGLAWAAVCAFLLPLIPAVVGALIFAAWGTIGAILGGAGGLILGALAIGIIRRWAIRRHRR